MVLYHKPPKSLQPFPFAETMSANNDEERQPSFDIPIKFESICNDGERRKYAERIAHIVATIHFAKCNRGDECPMGCREFPVSEKRKLIDTFLTSKKGLHYADCHVRATDIFLRGACNCGTVRFALQRLQERYFPHRKLSLELLAACAVPYIPRLIFHPMGETTIALRSAAIKVQRQWRAFWLERGKRNRLDRDMDEDLLPFGGFDSEFA